jgi:ankyrin repeat protein
VLILRLQDLGWTALHWAANRQRESTVTMLLDERKADIFAKDKVNNMYIMTDKGCAIMLI